MRIYSGLRIGILFCICLPVASHAKNEREPDAVTVLRLDQPAARYNESFIPLVPTIHLPTTHSHEDLIQCWLQLPPDAELDAARLDDGRITLLYPVGSVADRAEYLFTGDTAPDLASFAPLSDNDSNRKDWTVVDIRGTRLSQEGQYFHVYRPDSGAPHSSMSGWEWPKNVPDSQQRATELLARHAASHNAPLAEEPMPESAIAQLRRLNNCSGCHEPDKPSIRSAKEEDLIERATDSLGFVTPLATLTNGVVVVHHRPEDVNGEDPFVTVRCADGVAASLETRGDYEHFKCDDGTPPRGFRDFKAGMAQSHPYTAAVCESRRLLYQRMTDRARRLFARSFEVCDIN